MTEGSGGHRLWKDTYVIERTLPPRKTCYRSKSEMNYDSVGRENYFIVWDFMRDTLGLGRCELLIFAMVYGYDSSFEVFRASYKFISDWTGYGRTAISAALASLQAKHLIKRHDAVRHGVEDVYYTVDDSGDLHERIKAAKRKNGMFMPLYSFMRYHLELEKCELMVYMLIFGIWHRKGFDPAFRSNYMCDRLGYKKTNIYSAIDSLEKKGVISIRRVQRDYELDTHLCVNPDKVPLDLALTACGRASEQIIAANEIKKSAPDYKTGLLLDISRKAGRGTRI